MPALYPAPWKSFPATEDTPTCDDIASQDARSLVAISVPFAVAINVWRAIANFEVVVI